MKIINTSETFRIIDLMNQYDDLYFEDLNICAHPYRSSLVIIDLTNGIKTGVKVCRVAAANTLRQIVHCAHSCIPLMYLSKYVVATAIAAHMSAENP